MTPRTPADVVTDIAIVLAPAHTEDTGLLGWCEATIGSLRVHGIAVRRDRQGDVGVTWPAKRTRRGTMVSTITISDTALRRRIEAAVLAAYVTARAKAGRAAP